MFWLIIGLILGVFFFWLATAAKFKLTWYEWILTVLAVILALYAIQNYSASLVELEPRAAGILLALFGLPAVILALVDGLLVWNRLRKAPAD